MASKQEMYDSADYIRSEQRGQEEVTHQRVGTLFHNIIEWLGDTPGGGTVYPSPTGNDTYLHWNGSSYNWTKPSGGAQLGGFLNSLNSFTQPTSVQTGYLHYNGDSGQLEWTDIPSGSGITEPQMWTALTGKATWWGRNLTQDGNNYKVTGSLSGNIDFIEFKNGVKLGVDTQDNTLKVYKDNSDQANFYATGGISALGYDASGGGGGGGSSFEPNDLIDSLNTTAGMPNSGQILVYRGAGWAYEDKPTGGGSGGEGMTEDQMWGYLRSQDTNENKQIDSSHLNNLSWWGNKFNTAGNTATAITGLIQADNGIKIGNAYLTWDNINHALKVSDGTQNDDTQMNFYATGGVSALGYDASGGGGDTGITAIKVDGSAFASSGDTVDLIAGSNVTLSTNSINKSITISASGGGQGGGGTVTRVGLQMPTGFNITGTNPIIDSGTFNVDFASGYSLVDSGDRSNWNGKLNETTYNDFINNTTWWGQKITNGVVQGDMEAGVNIASIKGFCAIELNTHNKIDNHGGFIDFHYNGAEGPDGTIYPDYTARIIEDSHGILHVQSMIQEETQQKAGLHVGQSFKDSFVQIGNVKLVYDGDSAIRVEKSDGTAAHFYATGGVSALGIQPEVTGLESFTISNLNSTQIKIADKSTIWNSVGEQGNPDNLVIETDNPRIRFKVNTGTEAAQIHAFGVQSSRFYLDGTHFLTYKDGALEFFDGTSYKKVVLQDI